MLISVLVTRFFRSLYRCFLLARSCTTAMQLLRSLLLLLLLLFVVCSTKHVTHPVFPDVDFVFHDDYDPLGWRLTKPDFLQLPRLNPNESAPVLMFYMRKSDSAAFNDPFYSWDCLQCQLWVSYSYDGGLVWKTPFCFLGLPTGYLDPTNGWWGRDGPRVSLQQFNGVSSLHIGIGKRTTDQTTALALFHFSTNGSLPDGRHPRNRNIFPSPQVVMSENVGTLPHT